MIEPRYYQEEGVEAVWEALSEPGCNPLLVLPTGTGKALCIAMFAWRAISEAPDCRIIVATHSKELVQQDFDEMMGLWPECPAGVHCAGLGKKDIQSQVIFASIGSIHKKAYQLQRVDLVIVDEAQAIPRKDDTMWRKFLSDLKQINPDLQVWGATATPYRMESGLLHKGPDALFTKIAYEYPVNKAIADGFLCPPVTRPSGTQIDTSNVGTRGGEFIAGALEMAAMDDETINAIADEVVQFGADRLGWGIFGCGVKHCTALRDAIRARGYSCEGVFATTPSAERDAIIKAFRNQEIRAITSVNALTTGFNAKHLDLVVLARPTRSPGLYIQSVGRGLRLYPGKENALILDMGGNIARFGPIDAIEVKDKRKSDVPGEMPTKKCEVCEALSPISATECVECGHPFDVTGSKISIQASDLAILTEQMKPAAAEWVDVTQVTYARHKGRDGKSDTLRADIWCGLVKHSKWVSIEGTGYARDEAFKWWRRRETAGKVPQTIDEALAIAPRLPKPRQIQVKKVPGKPYTEVVNERFA